MKGGTAISPCATGTTCPVTVADTAAPPAAVTVHSIVEGRCISTPCRTVYRDSPSPGSSPEATSHTPNPRADEPVAGSSGTPTPGQKTRVCATRVSGSQAKTVTIGTPVAGLPFARPSASGRTDRYGNSRPQPAVRGAGPAKSSAVRPAVDSSSAGASSGLTVWVPPVG